MSFALELPTLSTEELRQRAALYRRWISDVDARPEPDPVLRALLTECLESIEGERANRERRLTRLRRRVAAPGLGVTRPRASSWSLSLAANVGRQA